jgi:RimJ/RimL family protein N-acetyltransferase
VDDRIDDRPSVLESCRDPEILRWRHRPEATVDAAGAYIADRLASWARDERCSWAVCDPATGRMLGEVELVYLDLPMGTAEATCWALPEARGRGMTSTALGAVVRFGFSGLGLHRVAYLWAVGNTASARVAARCGFVVEGRQRSAWAVDGHRTDVMVSARLATDC